MDMLLDMKSKLLFVALVGCSTSAFAQPAAIVVERCNVTALQAIAPSDTTIASAARAQGPVPYCAVKGYVTTDNPGPNKVNFELALPDDWKGRYYFGGNGGAGGIILDPPITHVAQGFAAVAEDTGHQSKLQGFAALLDWSPLLNNNGKKIDWGYRSVHVVAQSTQAITQRFYNAKKMTRYYRGCSKGGAQGLSELQRFPKDFDGFVIGAPGVYSSVPSFAMISRFAAGDPGRFLPRSSLEFLEHKAITFCDAQDGAKDGLIGDPNSCRFNPAVLLCKPNQTDACLTPAQVAMVNYIVAPKRTKSGRNIYPGYPISNPTSWKSFVGAVAPDSSGTAMPWSNPFAAPMAFTVPSQMLRYVYFDEPDYNFIEQFDATEDATFARFVKQHKATGNYTDSPNLTPFKNTGGKVLFWHGWSDAALSPYATLDYFNAMQQAVGGAKTADEFSRLYLVPGTEHCSGGIGPQDMPDQLLTKMIGWVETGEAPTSVVASRPSKENRPGKGFLACPFPQTVRFKGGDVDRAENYECVGTR